jgi:hypothetical protein
MTSLRGLKQSGACSSLHWQPRLRDQTPITSRRLISAVGGVCPRGRRLEVISRRDALRSRTVDRRGGARLETSGGGFVRRAWRGAPDGEDDRGQMARGRIDETTIQCAPADQEPCRPRPALCALALWVGASINSTRGSMRRGSREGRRGPVLAPPPAERSPQRSSPFACNFWTPIDNKLAHSPDL